MVMELLITACVWRCNNRKCWCMLWRISRSERESGRHPGTPSQQQLVPLLCWCRWCARERDLYNFDWTCGIDRWQTLIKPVWFSTATAFRISLLYRDFTTSCRPEHNHFKLLFIPKHVLITCDSNTSYALRPRRYLQCSRTFTRLVLLRLYIHSDFIHDSWNIMFFWRQSLSSTTFQFFIPMVIWR